MPSLSIDAPIMAPHRKFTVEDFHRLGETGILGEHDRVELIEGELIDMAPIGPVHACLVSLLVRRLGYGTEGRAIPWPQNPIRLGHRSEPQPDFALLRYRSDAYKEALPTADDVLLLVEIADSSMGYDRDVKVPLYARHGIPEYWIIDIPDRRIEVHREPDSDQGCYRERRIVCEGSLAPVRFPDISVDLAELLH